MSLAFELLSLALALLLLVPAAVFALECLLALLPRRAPPVAMGPAPSFVVLVPAHDEEAGVGATVTALLGEVGPSGRVLVVADNCGDGTAAAARAAGAEVVERRDPTRRGKGFALAFGMEALAARPPEVVIIFDADCRVSPGGLVAIAGEAVRTGRPVQADYLLLPPAVKDPKAAVSGLALLVRNRVRPRGLAALGLPCHLMGSGMAFPYAVLARAPHTGANLVEDLVMGLDLTVLGHPPLYHPEVEVKSELPAQAQAAMGQRRRWEHGTLSTVRAQLPRLVWAGLRSGRPALLAVALDLAVPPLALLVMLLLAGAAAAAAGLLLGLSIWPLALMLLALALVGLGVLLAWARFGRALIPFGALLAAPLYVAWKIPLYLSLLLKGRQKTWERTARDGEGQKP